MVYAHRTVGSVAVHALTDAEGPFFDPLESAFPGPVSEDSWAAARQLDPGAFRPGGWWLQFRCFAIRLEDGQVIVVDTGIGPADSPAAAWAPVPGHLPERLAHVGISPAEVDTVVLTHVHTDHVGWAVTDGRPYFENARYLLQRAELDALPDLNPRLAAALIEPLQATDQLQLLVGDARLAEGVRVVATPGHTPGHQSVLVESGDETLALAGDLLVHAVQLVDPAVGYAIESDQELARRSREAFLRDLPPGAWLGTAHLTEPFVQRP